ncbi:MAG: tRNA lysidine(34) synthetase TilS [Nesterenkonia sp.]|nr:tRNA lysidine(34) synthetase TilS [Nesterenkonia sp.]
MSPALPRAVAEARRATAAVLSPDGLTLVACSGGADSLALAAAAAHLVRRGEAHVGAVVVDHGLQPDSAEVTATAVDQLRGLGLDPVVAETAEIDPESAEGPEGSARTARYRAFARAMGETGARRILLAHTRDDQAEQVLLGLARGSGTRSVAGIPRSRGPFRRPLLDLTRRDTETICAHAGLTPWSDPSNSDPALLRSRVRTEILPLLEERLSPTIRGALARTARIAADDADHLDAEAQGRFADLVEDPDAHGRVRLDLDRLDELSPAIRRRVLALAVIAVGGARPSMERIEAVDGLRARTGSAGPVEMEGGARVHRGTTGSAEYGKLVLVPPGAPGPPSGDGDHGRQGRLRRSEGSPLHQGGDRPAGPRDGGPDRS